MSKDELNQEFPHFQIITDCWRMMKEFYDPKDSDEYWNALHEKAAAIYARYPMEFTKEQLVTVMNEIDRIHRRKKIWQKK